MKMPGLWAALILIANASLLNAQQASVWAFKNIIPGKHRGQVSALFQEADEIISAGTDGFLEIWDKNEFRAKTRFQISLHAITAMDKHPSREEICVAESDSLGLYRVSVWNYRDREKLFSLRFNDPVAFISYSAGGNFIIAARSGSAGFVFIDSLSGELINAPEALSASITFAATGRSGRSMISYSSSGILSYWDLAGNTQTNRFNVTPGLEYPVIFGNNRFFAGIHSSGLTVIDAVSGDIIDRNNTIPSNSMLALDADELYCLVRQGQSSTVHHFSMDRSGKLTEKAKYPVLQHSADVSAFSASSGSFALGLADGNVLLYNKNGESRLMEVNDQVDINAAAVSASRIAFLTAGHELEYLPLDYSQLALRDSFNPRRREPYTKISPVIDSSGRGSQFLLWQSGLVQPLIVSVDPAEPPAKLNETALRFPLRSVQAFDRRLLLLDTAGNLSVLPFAGGTEKAFTFSSVGATDAAFINRDNVLLCRSAVLGNTPFVMINAVTGETVPLPWACEAAVQAYRGSGGNLYALIAEEDKDPAAKTSGFDGIKTSLIKLNTSYPAYSEKILEYPGEDTQFLVAEAGSYLAAVLNGDRITVYNNGSAIQLEGLPGLPYCLYGAENHFIVLDTEGNIAWYEAHSGKLMAVFTLYNNEWMLQTQYFTIRNEYGE